MILARNSSGRRSRISAGRRSCTRRAPSLATSTMARGAGVATATTSQMRADKAKPASAAHAGRYASAAQQSDQRPDEDRRQRVGAERDANPNERHERARSRMPTFAPKTRPNPSGKARRPALTSPMVVMVVALDDCTSSVMKAPESGAAAALLSTVRREEPARALSPLVMTVMPNGNRPTPPRFEIVST